MEVGPTIITYKSACLIISVNKVTRRPSLGLKRNLDTSCPCSFMSKFSQWEINRSFTSTAVLMLAFCAKY